MFFKHLTLGCLLILCLTASTNASNNKFFIGVSFSLNGRNFPDLKSIRPWVDIKIYKSTPNEINRFRLGEIHHLYIGAVIFTTGHLINNRLLRTIGGILIIDDTVQHIFRINSPIHMLSNELYRYKWYQDLVKTGDSVIN